MRIMSPPAVLATSKSSSPYKYTALNLEETTTTTTTATNIISSPIRKIRTSQFKFLYLILIGYLLIILIYIAFTLYNQSTPKPAIEFENLNYDSADDASSKSTSEKTTKPKADDGECYPIKSNYETNPQFTVTIDGIKYPTFTALHHNNSIDFDCINSRNVTKKILAWTTYFNDPEFMFGMGLREPFVRKKCPVNNCEMTNDKSQLNTSDIVLVHMRDPVLPFNSKKDGKRFVFVLYESPMHSPDFSEYNAKFNYTMTYRMDSDFPGFYEEENEMMWQLNDTFDEKHDYSRNKTKFAFAIISNCFPSNRRMTLISNLQKFVQVDIFGDCGRPCPAQGNECKAIFSREYKFFLAFENSNCLDYITEKFHRILKYDIVPVVYGGGNYSFFVPKSGYINAADFQKAEHLADYLLYLSKNQTAYNSYFQWKKYVVFRRRPLVVHSPICDLCIQLHLEDYFGAKKQVIASMRTYWHQNKCTRIETIE